MQVKAFSIGVPLIQMQFIPYIYMERESILRILRNNVTNSAMKNYLKISSDNKTS